jgi:hypothetical protein
MQTTFKVSDTAGHLLTQVEGATQAEAEAAAAAKGYTVLDVISAPWNPITAPLQIIVADTGPAI